MSDLNYKLSWGLVHLGYNVPDNYACPNQATHSDIVETWEHSDDVPTEQKILDAYDDWVEAEKKIQYQRDRKVEYDALNQFELMTDDAANGTTTHADAIAAIKTKYPKG